MRAVSHSVALLSVWLLQGARALAIARASGIGTRTLGIDFGTARTGLAISSGFAPLPIRVLSCNGTLEDFDRIALTVVKMAAGEGANQLVLGLPLNSSGGEGEQANITRYFGQRLADAAAPMPVYLWDERFSTAEARIRTHGKRSASEAIDAIAAAVILESFFASPELSAAECIEFSGRKLRSTECTTTPVPPKAPVLSFSEQRQEMMRDPLESSSWAPPLC